MEEEKDLVETLKSRGITCGKLRSMENDSMKDAKKFRESGFEEIAKVEEQVANKIKGLRKKVCLLK
jgi:hypothetical protein